MQREASSPLFIRNSKCRLSCKVVYNSNWLFLQLSFLSHWLRFQHIHFEQTDTILGAPSLSVQALPEHGARLTPETLSQCQCRSPSPNIPWLLLPAQEVQIPQPDAQGPPQFGSRRLPWPYLITSFFSSPSLLSAPNYPTFVPWSPSFSTHSSSPPPMQTTGFLTQLRFHLLLEAWPESSRLKSPFFWTLRALLFAPVASNLLENEALFFFWHRSISELSDSVLLICGWRRKGLGDQTYCDINDTSFAME